MIYLLLLRKQRAFACLKYFFFNRLGFTKKRKQLLHTRIKKNEEVIYVKRRKAFFDPQSVTILIVLHCAYSLISIDLDWRGKDFLKSCNDVVRFSRTIRFAPVDDDSIEWNDKFIGENYRLVFFFFEKQELCLRQSDTSDLIDISILSVWLIPS